MLTRDCAGGVVFRDHKVLIMKNEKGEWVLPKGRIRGNDLSTETALQRVRAEAGVEAKIVSPIGETAYEFYSVTREEPVFNKITWYVMESDDLNYKISKEEGFSDGGFYPVDKALEMITYSQDKSLLALSNERYIEFKEYQKNLEVALV